MVTLNIAKENQMFLKLFNLNIYIYISLQYAKLKRSNAATRAGFRLGKRHWQIT